MRRIRRKRRSSGSGVGNPQLTSLMDVLTIVLVYLIKGFVVSPINVQDPSVELPKSTSMEGVQDAIVVMITGKERRAVVGTHDQDVPEIPAIVVGDKVLLHLDREKYRVPDNQKDRGYVITRLKEELLELKKDQQDTAAITKGEGFNGKIAIVADKDTPYRVLTDVLVTCGEAGFGEFKFIIVKTRS